MVQKLIVGLGNPETKFAWTRHNAGFHVLTLLANNDAFKADATLKARVAIVTIEGKEVALACPTTGMNSTGEAVKALLAHFSLTVADLLIVQDDVSMPMGKLRFQHEGRSGGHHGIESTIHELEGNAGFDRLKLAVGPDVRGDLRMEFLLSPITNDVAELYHKAVKTAAEAVKHWVESGVQSAMCRFNGTNLAAR
jgi:PTH1 family peptidyl-tRNA hydrolase